MREIGDVKVKKSIVIVIAKRRSHAPLREVPMWIGDARLLADFRERAVTIIAIQLVGTEAGHVNVGKAIVVVITNGAAAVPARIAEMRLRGDVGKRPVAIVSKQVIVGMLPLGLRSARDVPLTRKMSW